MKNNSLIRSLALAPAFALVLLSACAHDDKAVAGDHNLALSPLPVRADGADSHNLAARAAAPAAVAVAPVASAVEPGPVVVAPKDPCVPSILSAGAVGKPCLTTAEFIASLNLPAKEEALALRMVKAADKRVAH